MSAEITLLRRVAIRIDVECIIRTRLHTRLTPDAATIIKIHNAIVAFEERRGRTDGYAGRVNAMITAQHRKKAACLRVLTLFNVFNPGAISADWYFVFRFAGNRAGMATNTFAMVNQKSDFHKQL
jgi:hypothetical protein